MQPFSLQNLQQSVSSNVRRRGEEYARGGSVTILAIPKKGSMLRARVSGTLRYAVTARCEDGMLLAACSCPFFDQEVNICKHIWAVLLTAEKEKLSFGEPVVDLFADDEIDPGDSELDEDEDDEDADDGPAESRPSRYRWTPPPPPSRWRSQISQAEPFNDSLLGSVNAPALTADSQIIYLLDPAASSHSLSIGIHVRTPKKNGELSKPRNVRLTSGDLARLRDPLDREIMAMLNGASRYGYSGLDAILTIDWPAAEYLVPRLVATGRLWIKLPAGGSESEVLLDQGPPWRLVVTTRLQKDKYVLDGRLERDAETLPLREALAITRGGFVITPGRIAHFADEGTHGWASLLRRDSVEIPAAEADDFIRAMAGAKTLPRLEFPTGMQWTERSAVLRATLDLRLTNDTYTARATAAFHYDGLAVDPFIQTRALYEEATKSVVLRDVEAEGRHLNALWAAGFSRINNGVSIARARLPSAIPGVIEAGWEVRGSEGIYRGSGALDLAVTSGIDWFDLEATATFGTERVRLPRLIAALRKGESLIKLDDGTFGLIPDQWKAQLAPFLAAAAEESESGFRFRRNQVLLLDALLSTRPQVRFDETFDHARRRILEVHVAAQQPPDGFHGQLRHYQQEGLGWFSLLRDLSFGGCLADDMGLGKTVQVLALLEQRRTRNEEPRRPSLIVVPRSLVFNWKAEAARFTPALRILDHTAPDRIRESEHFEEHDVVLTTYGLLRSDAELFAKTEFDYAILDEAQAIKNAASQSAKASRLIQARHRLALSGTPVENHLGELASLFEFLNPGMLRGNSSRMSTLLRDAGRKGDEAAAARTMLARAVRPFILRRTKAQVASELPARVEQTTYCDLGPLQRKLYDELRDYYRASLLGRIATKGMNRSKMHVLEALLRLRQAACHPGLVDRKLVDDASAKLEVLFEELEVILAERHKVLVFSQFTSLLAIVKREVERRGIRYVYLDGKTRDRQEPVRQFQEDPDVPLFLVSLKAGGLGLNLTAAEYVFLLDPWWNPAVEAQAIDRTHRIGQTRNVFAYRLVARDTIEEKILQLQQSKRSLADAIISEENGILRQLTAEDLGLLLS